MQVAEKSVVGIEYTLKNDEGNVLDTSEGKQPLHYIHGVGMIIPGLEEALNSKAKGEKFNVRIDPDKAYGQRSDEMIQKLGKDQFDMQPEVGMQFQADTPNGPTIITIIEVSDTDVTVDANHPLAGVTLNFDVEVIEVREATTEELEHGHVHASQEACNDASCGC